MGKTYINDGGTWRNSRKIYVNDGGSWTTIRKVWVNDGGTWRIVHRNVLYEGSMDISGIVDTMYGMQYNPPIGAMTPNNIDGNIIWQFYSDFDSGVDQTYLNIFIGYDPGQYYFSTIEIDGVGTLSSDNAISYSWNGGNNLASWVWSGAIFFSNTTVPVTFYE